MSVILGEKWLAMWIRKTPFLQPEQFLLQRASELEFTIFSPDT